MFMKDTFFFFRFIRDSIHCVELLGVFVFIIIITVIFFFFKHGTCLVNRSEWTHDERTLTLKPL